MSSAPARLSAGAWLRETVAAYLPLLLMALLALATGWLVKSTPLFQPRTDAPPPRHEPDYSMQGFSLKKFDAQGRLRVQIDGEQLRHFPDTDTVEMDDVTVRTVAPQGAVTLARARQAVVQGDGSQLELLGQASVVRDAVGGKIEFRGEHLQILVDEERVESGRAVTLRQGGNEFHAAGLRYDAATQRVVLQGPLRATIAAQRR